MGSGGVLLPTGALRLSPTRSHVERRPPGLRSVCWPSCSAVAPAQAVLGHWASLGVSEGLEPGGDLRRACLLRRCQMLQKCPSVSVNFRASAVQVSGLPIPAWLSLSSPLCTDIRL